MTAAAQTPRFRTMMIQSNVTLTVATRFAVLIDRRYATRMRRLSTSDDRAMLKYMYVGQALVLCAHGVRSKELLPKGTHLYVLRVLRNCLRVIVIGMKTQMLMMTLAIREMTRRKRIRSLSTYSSLVSCHILRV